MQLLAMAMARWVLPVPVPPTTQLSKEEFQQLQPKAGEQVFVELKNVKIFSEDFSI